MPNHPKPAWLLAGSKPQAIKILCATVVSGVPPAAVVLPTTAPREDQLVMARLCRRSAITYCVSDNPLAADTITTSLDAILTCRYERLSRETIDVPTYGCYNLHNALLPSYRGVHPLTWAMINAEPWIGVTLHKINEAIDRGDIIFQHALKNDGRMNFWSIQHKLDTIASTMITHFIKNFNQSIINTHSPSKYVFNAPHFYAKRRTLKDSKIDWNLSSSSLINLARALPAPYPPPFCYRPHGQVIEFHDIKLDDISNTREKKPGFILNAWPTDHLYRIRTGTGSVLTKSFSTLAVGERLN